MEPKDVIDFVILIVYTLAVSLIEIVKAFIPNGILPRKNVAGKTVLITGSGSGLGRMMAIEFGKLGARIVLWDVNEKGNTETRKKLMDMGVKAHAYTVDLSKKDQINETAQKVKCEVGNVDILINNAGIVTGKKLFECPDDLMEKTMQVNTNALFYTTKNFLPGMLESNSGHLVTIASMAGQIGVAGLVDYCASKFGAVGYHESVTAEIIRLGKSGVNTTLICPYYIDTGMFDGVESKSPLFLPILEPEYVIECIMEGVLTNRRLVAMPRFCYLSIFAKG
ncbi:hypothetical protein WR25_13464 isoform B [Diploscapter pachys]|nr:hypothetical protein WR25_13464 isoform B [Diploscapter pachys]